MYVSPVHISTLICCHTPTCDWLKSPTLFDIFHTPSVSKSSLLVFCNSSTTAGQNLFIWERIPNYFFLLSSFLKFLIILSIYGWKLCIPQRTPWSFASSISSNIFGNFEILSEFIWDVFGTKKTGKGWNWTGLQNTTYSGSCSTLNPPHSWLAYAWKTISVVPSTLWLPYNPWGVHIPAYISQNTWTVTEGQCSAQAEASVQTPLNSGTMRPDLRVD